MNLGGDENSNVLIFPTEKLILKPNDVSVFSALSINGRLFACPRDQLSNLVRDECFHSLLGTSEVLMKFIRLREATCMKMP